MPSCDDKPIWDLWLSSMWLPALTVAAELGVFEALEAGPATATALAGQLELRPRACEILHGYHSLVRGHKPPDLPPELR